MLTLRSLALGGTAVFFLCVYLLYRLFKCSRRRIRPQTHSRRHSQTFSHTIYQQPQNRDGRQVSNYSFPLPSRLPSYRQATHLRSPSRMSNMQQRAGSPWPLQQQQQSQNLARSGSRDDSKPPSPTSVADSATSSTPSQISVASTLVAMPLPARMVDFTSRRQAARTEVVSPISTDGTIASQGRAV